MATTAPLNYKQVFLAVMASVLGFLSFFSWHNLTPAITDNQLAISNFTWPIVSLGLAAIFFAFATIFVKNDWIVYVSALLGINSSFFLLRANAATVWALLATVFMVVLALHRIKHEVELSSGFSLSKILKSGLPLYFTAASLVVSVYYFEAVQNNENKAMQAIFPKPASSLVLKILSGKIQSLVGFHIDIRPDDTVDQVLQKALTEEFKKEGISLSSMSKRDVQNLINVQRQEIVKKYNLPVLSGGEKLSDVFYGAITAQLNNMIGPYKIYLPFISAFAFFLAFKAFTLPLYYVVMLVSFILLKLAIFGKIIRKEKVKIEVERLAL